MVTIWDRFGNDCYQICYFWDIGKVPNSRGQRVTRHRTGWDCLLPVACLFGTMGTLPSDRHFAFGWHVPLAVRLSGV